MLFFLFINVKMPTIVGILTFMRRKISCSAELSMEFCITLGQDIERVAQCTYQWKMEPIIQTYSEMQTSHIVKQTGQHLPAICFTRKQNSTIKARIWEAVLSMRHRPARKLAPPLPIMTAAKNETMCAHYYC